MKGQHHHVKTVLISIPAQCQILSKLNKMNRKAGNGDSARKALRISQHTLAAPNLFTGPGVAVNAWQTPKSQRCRKPRCVVEHVIHLFTCTCFSFGSFVSLVFFLYIYIIEAWRFGLVW